MARLTQRKRRRLQREPSAKSAPSSSDDGGSDDDREEGEERRWQTRRSVRENNLKRKGKELMIEEELDETSCSTDSFSDDDDDSGEEEIQMERVQSPPKEAPKALDEICGICLSESGNDRGKLDCCEHIFCFGCIMEWAKVESRCPMCKQRFLTVTRPTTSNVSRGRNRIFRIPTRDQVYEPSEEEIRLFTDPYQNTVCTECQEAGDEGLLLLCDRCDAAAHTYCVGLGRSVPRGDWYCQACQLLDRESSGEEDEEDPTFDTIDADEDESSGPDSSILAMLVADMQQNGFVGRASRSSAMQGPMQLRRSTRRRARRSSISDSSRPAEALMNRSGFLPSLMESYGAARTLFRQRQVQATVHNRLQNMRENWNRYQSGEIQFSSVGHSVESTRPPSETGSLPSSSSTRFGHGIISATATPMDVGIGEGPATPQNQGAGRSAEEGDLDLAWSNLDRARILEGNFASASQSVAPRSAFASERRNREVKVPETPVCTRSKEKQTSEDGKTRTNGSSSRGEQHSHVDVQSRANNSRGSLSERYMCEDVPAKANGLREGLNVFLNTRSSTGRDSGNKESSGQVISATEAKFPDRHVEMLSSAGDNSRGGYHLRENNRLQICRTTSKTKESAPVGGTARSPTLRESRFDSEVLQTRSLLDDKDNSRGSGGSLTRRREAKELHAVQGQSLLDGKDNSRGSGSSLTRRREVKDLPAVLGQSLLDCKDNSRGSGGTSIRRREAKEVRAVHDQSLLDGKDNSRGSGGSLTRREAKELQAGQGQSILDDKDNSRSSTVTTLRRRDSKDSHCLLGKSILDDSETSRGSTGPITRREAERTRSQSSCQVRDQSTSRDPTKDEAMKLMKEQCNNLVQFFLKPIFEKGKLDKTQYKDLARSATHTILSSLGVPGLKYATNVALVGDVACDHEEPTSSSLIPGCCDTCVERHVKRFVKTLVREKTALHALSV